MHFFTVDEVNTLIPSLESHLLSLQSLGSELAQAEEELAALMHRMAGNGHGMQGQLVEKREAVAKKADEIRNLVSEIQKHGCIVKDLTTGLLDFPAIREGKEVYLCWKLGERSVQFWHHIDSGFAGRQPL